MKTFEHGDRQFVLTDTNNPDKCKAELEQEGCLTLTVHYVVAVGGVFADELREALEIVQSRYGCSRETAFTQLALLGADCLLEAKKRGLEPDVNPWQQRQQPTIVS